MKTGHIALLSAIGLSTVAIAQTTTPQTTPDNGTDNMTTAPIPAPGNVEDVPTAPTPTVPESDPMTTTTPDAPDTTTAPPGETATPQR